MQVETLDGRGWQEEIRVGIGRNQQWQEYGEGGKDGLAGLWVWRRVQGQDGAEEARRVYSAARNQFTVGETGEISMGGMMFLADSTREDRKGECG